MTLGIKPSTYAFGFSFHFFDNSIEFRSLERVADDGTATLIFILV